MTAWGGPYTGTVNNIPASEWTSYLPVANHPEYPSASTGKELLYRKSSIRSRPCIILNLKFPILVLKLFQKL